MRKIFCTLMCLVLSAYVVSAQSLSSSLFKNPDLKYAPSVRWWWPGNDVDNTELKRELELFATNHIGGVEIQSFALVVPMPQDRAGAIMSLVWL